MLRGGLSDSEMQQLTSAIIACPLSKNLTEDQKPVILAIRKLKRYLSDNGDAIITWIYSTLKARKTTLKEMTDPVNQALVDLMKDCIFFQDAINNTGSFNTFFNLVEKETVTMSWLLCLIGEKLPQLLTRRMHEILIQSFANFGNPYLATSNEIGIDKYKNMIYISGQLFKHLLNTSDNHKEITINSVIQLFDEYVEWINNDVSFNLDIQKYTLSYIMSLPKLSPVLFEESWTIIFKRLYDTDTAGTIFYFEKQHKTSLVRTAQDKVEDVASVFPRWLTAVAFEPKGLIMKHAMDVAIMIDTLAYDPRLDLKYMIPSGNRSIIDSLKPSFEELGLKASSIDLVQWTISLLSPTSPGKSQRDVDDLKIPLFLLQLAVLKDDESKEKAADMFVQLITRLDRPANKEAAIASKYLVLNLISSAESKWPGIFALVMENIFSRAIAIHIVDSEGSVNVEKILGTLATIFEKPDEQQNQCGFDAFQMFLTRRWRQVLLLFVNHPSMECRAMGYRVLTNSRFWEKCDGVEGCEPSTVAKTLLDAWFRNMKGRYLKVEVDDEISAIEEHQNLIIHCCQNFDLAKGILSFAADCILGGALEIFPTIDINSLQQEKLSLLEKVQQNTGDISKFPKNYNSKKPPQFITTIEFQEDEEFDIRDKIYADNIQRTADIFCYFDKVPSEQSPQVVSFILSRLVSTWQPGPVPLNTYDDALPRNIPYQSDIVIGGAFKDHPVLFLIFEKYISIVDKNQYPINDMIRSILIYLIVFWYMKEVVNVPTTLRFATQLEETSRLMSLLSPLIPDFLVNSYRTFPFLSAYDLGEILFQVVWQFLRCHPLLNHTANIPGIKAANMTEDNQEELNTKCKKKLSVILNNRLEILKAVPSWHKGLSDIVAELNLSID